MPTQIVNNINLSLPNWHYIDKLTTNSASRTIWRCQKMFSQMHHLNFDKAASNQGIKPNGKEVDLLLSHFLDIHPFSDKPFTEWTASQAVSDAKSVESIRPLLLLLLLLLLTWEGVGRKEVGSWKVRWMRRNSEGKVNRGSDQGHRGRWGSEKRGKGKTMTISYTGDVANARWDPKILNHQIDHFIFSIFKCQFRSFVKWV